jgi:hypothetical protein
MNCSDNMTTEKIYTDKPTDHMLENLLDIDSKSTMVPAVKRNTELLVDVTYDPKDVEIEEQFQEVYDLALEAFEEQSDESKLVEGKYKARNSEIAAQYLNTALNAAKEKSTQKRNKDKIAVAVNKINSPTNMTQQNLIVGNRNDILNAIMKGTQQEPIDIIPQEDE